MSEQSAMTDGQREAAIQDAKHKMLMAPTRAGRIFWETQLRALVNARSPAQVARMERAQGLRA